MHFRRTNPYGPADGRHFRLLVALAHDGLRPLSHGRRDALL
jgi:hypothetical protein